MVLAEALPRIGSPAVRVESGALDVAGSLLGVRAQLTVVPELRRGATGDVDVWVERVRLGPTAIPRARCLAVNR